MLQMRLGHDVCQIAQVSPKTTVKTKEDRHKESRRHCEPDDFWYYKDVEQKLQTFLTINVIRMFSQNVFIELFRFVKFTHGLVEPGQVVGCCHRDGIVVMLIMLSLCFCTVQRCQEVFLKCRKKRAMKHSRKSSKKNFCVIKKHHSHCK